MERFRRLPFRFKVASITLAVLIFMLAAFALQYSTLKRITAAADQQAVSQDITFESGRLLVSLVDMETGMRGYVIAKQRSFLEPYDLGSATYPVALANLERMMADEPDQLNRLETLKNLINVWGTQRLQANINAVSAGGDATALVASGAGKQLMDEIRKVIDEIQQQEFQRAAARRAEADRASRVGDAEALLLSVLAALVGFWLTVKLSATVTRPVHDLVEAVDALSQGNYGQQVAVWAPDEVGHLAEGFNRLSAALQEHQEENLAQQEELQSQQEELVAQNEELHTQQETLTETMAQIEADRERLEMLNELTQIIVSSVDLPSLAEALLESMMAAGSAQVGALILMRDGGVRVLAHVGLSTAAAAVTDAVGFLSEAASRGEPVSVSYPNGALLLPVYHTQVPLEHELYVPIRSGGETLAVIALARTSGHPFTAKDRDWLKVLGSQAGTALSNRLAFEQLHQTYSELQDQAAQVEILSTRVQEERDRAQAQRDTLNAVLQTTSEGVWMIDTNGLTVLVNDRFADLTGERPRVAEAAEEVLSRLWPRMKNAEAAARLTLELMRSESSATDLVEFKEPQEMVLQRFTAPVYDDDGRRLGRLFVLRDVTRETEVDRMKTEFISTVSHELRTPLTSIRGFVDLILEGDAGPVGEEQREFLELVSRSTVRLANLINDLLDVEKIESGRIEVHSDRVDLTPILEQVVRTFTVSAEEKGLALSLRILAPLPPINGDADRLMQVCSNLLSNAIKYTKSGSITVEAYVENQSLKVAITDTGIGIASEHLPKLFHKFYRVDNEYTREVGGTGLGLAIIKAIVERHGGRVEVSSQVGRGSTFTVIFPIQRGGFTLSDKALVSRVAEVVRTGARHQGLVLIIEDDANNATLIANHVGRLGLGTVVAASGGEGLSLARSLQPDLITLDVIMPDMDGWGVLAVLKQDPDLSRIPVVVVSILQEAQRAFGLGAEAYVTKPIEPDALSATIRRLLIKPRSLALLAVSAEAEAGIQEILEGLDCQVMVAEPAHGLADQALSAKADLLLVDPGWSPTPTAGLVHSVRSTPGLERLPVLVLTPGGVELAPVEGTAAAKEGPHELGPELLAIEIQRILSQR